MLYSTRQNCIIVMGKDADSAGTDGRIIWLPGMSRDCIWKHTIHISTHQMQHWEKKNTEWLVLSHLVHHVRCLMLIILYTDRHSTTLWLLGADSKKTATFHSAVFLFPFNNSHSCIMRGPRGPLEKKFLALCKHSVFAHLITINFRGLVEIK